MNFQLTTEAMESYSMGREDGTITDTWEEIIDIVYRQEVVSYCSMVGNYTFDIYDVVEVN